MPMSDAEQPALTTLAVPDVGELQPIMKFPNPKFAYEESEEEEEEEEESEEEEPECCKESREVAKIHFALEKDNKEKFLRLLQSPRVQRPRNLSFICDSIFHEGAVKCATAVIDGETNGIISPDFGFGLAEGQFSVMHRCAARLSFEFVSLFLQRGYPTDTRGDSRFLDLKNALPLNVALRQFRYRCLRDFWASQNWYRSLEDFWASQNWSASNLLMELGNWNYQLEALRLLALNTREFKHEFLKYVEDGKMAEVGAFLLAAGDKLMPLCISEGEDIVFNSFKDITHYLQAKKTMCMSCDKFREMKETLLLLDIYDKIGNQLTAYARTLENDDEDPKLEVAKLLEVAGFGVNREALHFPNPLNRLNKCIPENYAPLKNSNLIWSQSQGTYIPAQQLFHTSSSETIGSLTPANKLFTHKRWISFMTIFRRGVRRV